MPQGITLKHTLKEKRKLGKQRRSSTQKIQWSDPNERTARNNVNDIAQQRKHEAAFYLFLTKGNTRAVRKTNSKKKRRENAKKQRDKRYNTSK